MSSPEEDGLDKIADQSGIELLPLGNAPDDDDKSDVGSYHSGGTASVQSNDTTDAGDRVGGAKVKKPLMKLTQVSCACL